MVDDIDGDGDGDVNSAGTVDVSVLFLRPLWGQTGYERDGSVHVHDAIAVKVHAYVADEDHVDVMIHGLRDSV